MIIPDNETKIDLLNNDAIATNVVDLLLEHEGEPITIGVHGDWGAGKSSVLQMVEEELNKEKNVVCLRFDGWRFQGFEDAKIAIIEGIVTGLIEKRPMLTKASESVKNIFKRIDWLKLAKHGGGAAITAFTGIPNPDQIRLATSMLSAVISDPSKFADKEQIKSALESADGLLKPAEDSKKVPEEIREFRKAFDNLLKEAKIDQLIVLIDDLDRCLPKTVIETLEAIRLFVFTSKTAFVIAADEAMIEYSVREHFPDLPESSNSRDYARNYLEKLIQVPFRLPSLGDLETRIYVSLLLIGSELEYDDEDFLKLVDVAKQGMRKPWEGNSLETSTVKKMLGEKANNVMHAVAISEQIGHTLAIGTNGNPRQVKRFLNTLLLRNEAAEARGFGDEIEMPILAKLMLAERFIPSLFDRMAQAAGSEPKGLCVEIGQLEEHIALMTEKKPSVAKTKAKKGEAKVSSDSFPEWLTDPDILNWARIEPKLSKVDLRPYLFIAKERKDYFSGSALPRKLVVLAEKLMGQVLSIQGLSSQLTSLKPEEVTVLFEFIRGRIFRGGNFNKQPDGIEGLKALAKSNSDLQHKLIDFLDSLPTDKLGAWCIAGWNNIITEEETKMRLQTLIKKWSKVANNTFLSKAAEQTLRIPEEGRG